MIRHSSASERLAFALCIGATVLGLSVLLIVIALLAHDGWRVLSVHFLTAQWQHRDIEKGGIFPAIVGSVCLGLGVMLVSFPLGIGTGLYLTEYCTGPRLQRIIQLSIRNLAGVPSVVYGLFGLGIFVQALGFGMSILSAVLTLSVMTLPWIISSSVESLQSVPMQFRESSLALGATRWQTTRRIVLPCALPGSITGGIIGIARAMGETAPIILVGATFYLTTMPRSITDKFMALPYHVFILATQHSSPYALSYAAGTALVLMALTFVISLGAIALRVRLNRSRRW